MTQRDREEGLSEAFRINSNTKKLPCKGYGRNWSYATTNQDTPETTQSWKQQGRVLSPRAFEGNMALLTP